MDMTTIKEIVATSLKLPLDKLSNNILDKVTKELGEGLGNLFWLAFAPVLFARCALEPKIEQFKREIANEISKIPNENLVEPPLNIVGPALESSKYYIEDREIRILFAKLIASSIDSSKQSLAHPSFIEIIKQMSPLDAKNFDFLVHKARNRCGVAKIVLQEKNKEFSVIDTFFPFPDINSSNALLYSSSIDNLVRLGLISIDYSSKHYNEELYEPLIDHPFLEQVKNELHSVSTVVLKKGSWGFTHYGETFITCCF